VLKILISPELLNCFDDFTEGNSRNPDNLIHINTEKIIALSCLKCIILTEMIGKHNSSLVIKFYSRLGAKTKAKNKALKI